MKEVVYLFIYFFIYSIAGYFIELFWRSVIEEKRLVKDTGFFIGPWCPIYGVGAVLIITLLGKYKSDFIALFVIASVLCSLLEYITSHVLEKLFNKRWWDYSNYKYNLNGRICLLNSSMFGFSAIILINFVQPFLKKIILSISYKIVFIIFIILISLFIIDLIVSLFALIKLKEVYDMLLNNKNKFILSKKDPKRITEKKVRNYPKILIIFMAGLLKKFPNIFNSSSREIKRGFNYLIKFSKKRNKH